ncbi:d6493974-10b0-4b42-89f9-26135a502656 [Sclerotinia trifoliorum]|uniref:D6493974-10b0-4b42-89f9-26135a502656 n=1 Tax=Sclerotinia trifoliorum TaxID=28548 RepID=A0A8H2ZLT6_9HELO|nr:d6493974-10b0-4b42-89f9-26135a502656 [Sclerotinia trifoliorum]
MTCKMDYSVPITPFDTPPTAGYPTPMKMKKLPQDERPVVKIHDPATLEGQQIGAIISVKRALKPTALSLPLAKVGDFVEVLAHQNINQVEVESIRTGMTGTIDWEDLLPVPYDGKCGCLSGGCRCIYENWQAYSARHPLRSVPVYGSQDMSGLDVTMPPQTPIPPNARFQLGNITTKTHLEVNDPSTIAGQRPGAILVVKHHPHYPHDFGPILKTEIEDHCRYLEGCEGGWGKVKVENLRTRKEGFLRWASFKPVGVRKRCSCNKGHCYCLYEDFEKSKAYCEA